MKNKIRILIIAAVVIAFAGVYSVVDINTAIYNTKVDNSDYNTDVLKVGDSLVQTFTSTEEMLDGVEVKIAATENEETAKVSYQLTDSMNNVLAAGEKSLENLENGKFFEFRFDKLTGCKGKSYTFSMKLEQCDEETEISVYEVPQAAKGATVSVNEENRDGTLALRTITHRFHVETFVVTLFFAVYVILFMRWLAKLFKG